MAKETKESENTRASRFGPIDFLDSFEIMGYTAL
jgi:hypothetical protein